MTHIYTKVVAALGRQQTMEKVIEYLRTLDFSFVAPNTIVPTSGKGNRKYGWMLQKIGNKYNLSLQVGIKMWGKKNDKVIVYYRGNHIATFHIHWKDKADINFRKIIVRLKFPEYLNYDERRKWRTEYHKQLRDPNRVPSNWYLKILPDIKHI